MDHSPASIAPAPAPRQLRWMVPAIIATVVICTLIWFKITYPFGPSHCCGDELGASLRRYATDHDGLFPHGKTSPEASLSLLHTNYEPTLDRLRGKNTPLAITRAAWERHGELDARSCGWHYVEGLSATNDASVAVAWDKSWGLGHQGQRIRKFGREVIYADGRLVSKLVTDWPAFATDQREKLARLMASRSTNDPAIRWSDEETLGTNVFPALNWSGKE